ncbi:MAG: adenylyltransferase/cytidyltransferase family protein [Clostridia bacterium]|nr:adenylyltransferase/cytidyltransferase family protein [Clostridia bacterium]
MNDKKYYKRGLYTGAFDSLHIKHIESLKTASGMCEELIVAVSTDDVIEEYKHHKPSIPFEQRIAIISELKSVSKAIPQDNLYSKLQMCLEHDVDVLFSCDEYLKSTYPNPEEMTPKQIAGVERWEKFEQQLSEYGIDVIYLPRDYSFSSTQQKLDIARSINYQPEQGIMLYSEGECNDEAVFSL